MKVKVKLKFRLCTSWRRMGERKYNSTRCVTVAVYGVQWSDSCTGRFTPRTHWIGGWESSVVYVFEKRNLTCLYLDCTARSLATIPTELFRLQLKDCPLFCVVCMKLPWHGWCFTSEPPIRLHGVVLATLISEQLAGLWSFFWQPTWVRLLVSSFLLPLLILPLLLLAPLPLYLFFLFLFLQFSFFCAQIAYSYQSTY